MYARKMAADLLARQPLVILLKVFTNVDHPATAELVDRHPAAALLIELPVLVSILIDARSVRL